MTDSGSCAVTACFSRHYFTGKERDSESGNDYFKYRYLSSSMGRWLRPDPSGMLHADLGNPQEFNLYSYVGNRPLTFSDLEGLCWKGFQWACNIIQRVENRVSGFGFQTDDQILKNPNKRSQRKLQSERQKSYRKETQFVPDPDDDRPQLTAMVKGVARDTAGFPDVCSGGVFTVKGKEVSVGGARGEAGAIMEVDSKDGTSVGAIGEGSGGDGGTAGGGAIVGTGGVEGFGFVGAEADIGIGEVGAGVVGFSSGGVGVYAQSGAAGQFNEAGAYVNISTMGGCAQHK